MGNVFKYQLDDRRLPGSGTELHVFKCQGAGGSDVYIVSRTNWCKGLSHRCCSKISWLSVLGKVTCGLCHGITDIWGYVRRCFVLR